MDTGMRSQQQSLIDSHELLKQSYDILYEMYRKVQMENIQMRQELILEQNLNHRGIETMRKLYSKWTESLMHNNNQAVSHSPAGRPKS